MAILRLYFVAFIFLSAFYLLLRLYFRSLRKERLEKTWDAERSSGLPSGLSREDYIHAGLRTYDRSLRPKLLALVYVVPFIVIGVTLYVVNAD